MALVEGEGFELNKVHVGTMGWSYDFWTGNFYPTRMKPGEFLSEYSKHFSTVEVDSTFYRTPYRDTVTKWRDQTPPNFIFSIKFPRIITHEKMLKNCTEYMERFVERISLLKEKLGPMLLQFPHGFGPDNLHLLNDFLPSLPREYRFVVEIRNRKLLDDPLYSILRENEVALALVDSPIMPPIEILTSNLAYVRLEGDRRKVSGTLGKVEIEKTNEIRRWADKIRLFSDNVSEVFVYFSKYYSGHPPTDATQLLGYL